MNEDPFNACRPRLLGVAYGMLGELTEAEDVVQDAWLRWNRAGSDAIRHPEAFLVKVTTRLALDRLRSARARREVYVGPWLPEPLLTDLETPESKAIEAERLSLALLGTLERLNPIERAVLVLRDAFDLEYAEIADAVEKTPANVRQIAKRARDRIGDPGRGRPVSIEERERLALAFMGAALSGEVEQLRAMLAEDAILFTDGGGEVTAARKPIYGADRIARFMIGIQGKSAYPADPVFTRILANGDPAIRMDSASDGFVSIVAVEVADGAVRRIRSFNNPKRFPAQFPRAERAHQPQST